MEILHERISNNSLDEVQVFFPDPWHKKRHHKRRLINAEFVQLVSDRLKPGAFCIVRPIGKITPDRCCTYWIIAHACAIARERRLQRTA